MMPNRVPYLVSEVDAERRLLLLGLVSSGAISAFLWGGLIWAVIALRDLVSP
jgi:hypothetical protein